MKDYISNQLQYCGNKAMGSTCQLFYKATPIGSGVLIEIKQEQYLVSAAHVIEPNYIESMTIPNGEILIELQGLLVTTALPLSQEREDDKIDLGIIKLNKACSKEIAKRFRFIELNEIDYEHSFLTSHQYMFCGYPNETTVVKNMEMEINPIPLKVRTKMTNKELFIVPDYAIGTKWILDYDRNKQINISSKNLEHSPLPKGISGAGLWSIPCTPAKSIEDTDIRLIGIMTDYFELQDKVVCATNIKLVLDIIKKKFDS
ncbi:hypothetical protein OO010_03465 [Flavobacteriaceae bacterium KMM 6898]|nr:hypothetical protein [Flavobacteriaceae bacterium KMM 6898]